MQSTTRRERLLAYGFVAAIVAGLLWQCAGPLYGQSSPDSITRGAAVRRVDGTWRALDDSAHKNTLVASIPFQSNGDIRLNFLPGGGRVITSNVGDDESLAKLRIDCGASMAPDHMVIRCYDMDTGAFVPSWSSRWNGATTNLWPLTVQEPALS